MTRRHRIMISGPARLRREALAPTTVGLNRSSDTRGEKSSKTPFQCADLRRNRLEEFRLAMTGDTLRLAIRWSLASRVLDP